MFSGIRENSFYRAPGDKWAQETCAGYPQQRYIPGSGTGPCGIVDSIVASRDTAAICTYRLIYHRVTRETTAICRDTIEPLATLQLYVVIP